MTAEVSVTTARPISLTREGSVFRLAFRYHPDLVTRVKTLPQAEFDGDTRTWSVVVCAQAVQGLRKMFYDGLVDVAVDSLLEAGEDLPVLRPAVLRGGTIKRPFFAHLLVRGDDNTYNRLKSIPGAQWEKKAGALSFPPSSAVALGELVDRGVLDDPGKLLSPAGVVIAFDGRTGRFAVRGDERASVAFARNFPQRDIYAMWRERDLDVAFADSWTEEIYRGELARAGEGVQPDGLKIDLFPYQRQTVAMALERSGLGVFHEPGLGKTAVGIATGLELLNRKAISRVVIIVPAAVRTQWKREIIKFTGCDEDDVVVVKGDPKSRAAAYEAALTAPWFILHYDILGRDKKQLKPLFNGTLVIADEAHRLKSYQAARTIAAKELCRGAARRIALTGTPTERGPEEWFEVLSGFTVPGCLGSPNDFNNRYRFPARFGGFEGARNIPELRERSRAYYIRKTKREVAKHLPPLRVETIVLDPEPAYAAALRRAHREAADEIKAAALGRAGGGLLDQELADEVETGAQMTAVGMLRLLCSSPRLVAESDSAAAKALRDAGIVPNEDGPKIDELRTLAAEFLGMQERRKADMAEQGIAEATIDMVSPEKVVIFTFSKRMANLIAERFTTDGVAHVLFTGDTSADDRDAAVTAFMDPNSDVIAFIATDAGAEGLNLNAAQTLINADLCWTASKMWQRAQRIHRLDGTAPSYRVLNLTLAGTMEHGVQQLLNTRADLSDALFGENGGRAMTTGRRGGRSIFEEAMSQFTDEDGAPVRARRKPAAKKAAASPSAEVLPLPIPVPAADDEIPWPDEEPPVDDGGQLYLDA